MAASFGPSRSTSDEHVVIREAKRFRHSARLDSLERARREAIAVAVNNLPARIGENAVVDEQQIAIRQFDEIRFRNRLATEYRQWI